MNKNFWFWFVMHNVSYITLCMVFVFALVNLWASFLLGWIPILNTFNFYGEGIFELVFITVGFVCVALSLGKHFRSVYFESN